MVMTTSIRLRKWADMGLENDSRDTMLMNKHKDALTEM